jgi:REP-associated tyrosine transposase
LLTFCVSRRKQAFSDPVLASIACKWIRHFRDTGYFWLYAYVVMFDHVHVVCRLQKRDMHLSRIVAMLRSAMLVELRRYTSGFSWQRGYHERIVREGDDITKLVDYVLANPARAGIVKNGQQYAFAGFVDRWR